MSKLKVLLTGAAGRIGRSVTAPLKERYDLRLLDCRPVDGEPQAIQCNLTDFDALKRSMQGMDVVLHLAATPTEAPFAEQLMPNNILGVYNTLQAALVAGVRRVVFASTCQTVLNYPRDQRVEISDPVRPITTYAATKIFGEALGRYYHEQHGMEFVGLRLGAFAGYDALRSRTSRGPRQIWLSPRDAAKLFQCAIERPAVGYVLAFGTSITETEHLSLKTARELLGFEPVDRAADYFDAAATTPK